MATEVAQADQPEFLDNLEGLDDDWMAFLAGNSSAEDLDAAFGDLFSENMFDDLTVTGSPASGLTQAGSTSKDEEGSGSGTEKSEEGSKKTNSSTSGRSTSKRLGKRKGGELDEERLDDGVVDEEEVKRRARLMRNRESAQLSRQRKKAYVDELEERVRTLNATVAELNNTVNLISAENVSLRNQLAYFYSNGAAPGTPAKPVAYTPPMGVPMYPYTPGGYVMRPGATAPPVPIPRLKIPATTVKSSKKAKVSKEEGKTGTGKTKKLASLAAVGFLCLMALVFPLDLGTPKASQVPWSSDAGVQTGASSSRIGGRVLMSWDNNSSQLDWQPSDGGGPDRYSIGYGDYENRAVIDGSTFPANVSYGGNVSHRFPASILLPRENKVLKLDGDLIVQAVLAGNEAAVGVENKAEISYPPALLNSGVFQDIAARALRSPQRALPSTATPGALPSTEDDDDPQRKILSDLAGTVFSTGMCSEVFQFELSEAEPKASAEASQPSATAKRSGYHRRNLGTAPLSSELKRKKENATDLVAEKSPSSMVVSVFNPAQAGASAKDLARIFVVVLVDSVKYVTYSCMLPQVVSR